MTVFWAGATVVFLVIEGVTVGLTSIWFALGCAAALIVSLLGGRQWLQIALFLIVSVAALWFNPSACKKVYYRQESARQTPTVLSVGPE